MHGQALQRRGLSVEVAAKLGWKPCGGPSDDLWIAMPVVDQGQRIGTKYRTITGTKVFSQDKGTPQILYNIDCLRDPQLAGYPLVICEGELDAASAIQAGYPKTVSVPTGAPQTDSGAEWSYLVHAKPLLDNQRPIILAVDNDQPGQVLQEGLARRLGRSRCQALDYPAGKDLNDVLITQGITAVRHTLAQAHYMPLSGLHRLHELPERPVRPALDTHIPGLEPHFRVRRGDLVVVTGPPGHGKSSFVANLACNMAWHWQTSTAIASFESAVVPDLRRVLRSFRAECLEIYMGDGSKQVADEWINRYFAFVGAENENEERTLGWLLERFAAAKQRYDCGICCIDPWNEVSIADKPDGWTVEQWVSQSLKVVKNFAREHDVAFIIVAHPRKLGRDRYGNIPKPHLWDIADSASWANRCDVGIVIYRKDIMDRNAPTEISVEKSRDYYSIGRPGMVMLHWQPETSRFVRPL